MTSTTQTRATTAAASSEADLEERIKIAAYKLWEDEGRPEGKAEEHWSQACRTVLGRNQSPEAADATECAPEWLQPKRAEQAADAPTSKQPQPDAGSPAVEAPLDAIRRKLAERKTA